MFLDPERDGRSIVASYSVDGVALRLPFMICGHTDNVPYGDPRAMNNWVLATGRAEATRRRLALGGAAFPKRGSTG